MKRFSTFVLLLMMVFSIHAAELYTVWTESNSTLTYYYNDNRSSATGDKVELLDLKDGYNWGAYNTKVKKVVIDVSVQRYTPQSFVGFFSGTYHLPNVTQISGMSYLRTQNATTMEDMFYGMTSLTSVDLSSFNTSNVTDMTRMFFNCASLTTLNLSSFNTENVDNMVSMFAECGNLVTIKFGNNFATPKLKYPSGMFRDCKKLASIDLSVFSPVNWESTWEMFSGCEALMSVNFGAGFSTLSLTNMDYMFKDCSSLQSIDLRSVNLLHVTSMCSMFENCTSLQSVDLTNHYFNSNLYAHSMFKNCSSLRTIYCGEDLSDIKGGGEMFYGCTKLTGNNGTTYDSKHTSCLYARPDRGRALPGYFTTTLGPLPDPEGIEDVQDARLRGTKTIRDGRLIIICNGVEYSANGQMIQ